MSCRSIETGNYMLPFGSSVFSICRLLCCGYRIQKEHLTGCWTLLQNTSEPPTMNWRLVVPKPEHSTGWQQKGDGCSSSEFTVKLADVCVTTKDQSWKQEQKGERQSWCIISVTAEAHSWVLGAGKLWYTLSLVGEGWCPNQGDEIMGRTKYM